MKSYKHFFLAYPSSVTRLVWVLSFSAVQFCDEPGDNIGLLDQKSKERIQMGGGLIIMKVRGERHTLYI